MSTKCLTCGEVFVCKCDRASQESEESAQHNLQQLQAKIAACVDKFSLTVKVPLDAQQISDFLMELRQLSAVPQNVVNKRQKNGPKVFSDSFNFFGCVRCLRVRPLR